MKQQKQPVAKARRDGYRDLLSGIAGLLDAARRQAARSVNTILTATYWLIGRRIVEFEQKGQKRAEYGTKLLEKLSTDLSRRFGRGFSPVNLSQMKKFYILWSEKQIFQTLSEKFHKASGKSCSGQTHAEYDLGHLAEVFPLPWSAYVRLMAVKDKGARAFYESETLRGGWSVRQLDRQISSGFYERTLLSRNMASMLKRGSIAKPEDTVTPEEEIKDPYVLEFLGLKDEYSETDLEDALIHHLEAFLLELGGDFCFIARQKRLRVGSEWYRIDLVFFHRKLRCLVLIDLKVGKFTHADAGQMHLYLNYAREHWTRAGENPPVGLILCAEKDRAVAKYALEGLPNKVLAAEYKLALPDESQLVEELNRTRRMLEARGRLQNGEPEV
ncbi:MAG: DUF1016 domain-containing protein [Calditrichaeota bacterium]|nr:MAG: DUF1016 domain-containing protein [Calditrichota bacterium]